MSAKKHRRPILLSLVKWLGAPLLLLLAGLLVLFLVAQTPWAKRRLASLISREVGGYSLTIRNVTGVIPFNPRIETASVADADGEFLRLDTIQLDWSPLSLTRGLVEVEELRVNRVELLRTPRQTAPQKTKPSATGAPPVNVLVHALSLPRVQLAEPVLGEAAVFAADAAGHYRSPREFSAQLHVKRLDHDGLAGRIRINSRRGTLDFSANAVVPVNMRTASISTDAGELTASGQVSLRDKTLDATASLTLDDLSVLTSAVGVPIAGTARLRVQLAGPWKTPVLTGTLRSEDLEFAAVQLPGVDVAAEISLAAESADSHPFPLEVSGTLHTQDIVVAGSPWSGGASTTTFTGSAERPKDLALHLDSLEFSAPNGTITVRDGTFGISEKQFGATYQVDIPNLAPLLPENSPATAGTLRAGGRVRGTFDQFSATMEGAASEFSVGPLQPGELAFKLHAPSLPAERACDITLEAQRRGASFQLSGHCAYDGNGFSARGLQFRGPSTELDGDLHLNTANTTVEADLEGHADQLSWLSKFLDIPLEGSADLTVTADGPLKTPSTTAGATLRDLTVGRFSAEKATIEAHVINLAAAENSTVELTLHNAGSPAATIEKATLTLAGNRRNADLSVHLQNPRPAGVSEQLWSPATLTAQARWRDPLLSAEIILQNEAGDHLDISGELPVDHAPDTFRFQPAGSISGSADVNAKVESFAPLLLPPEQQVSGILRGQFRVNGTLAEPEVEGSATLDKGQYEHADLGTFSAAKGTLEARIANPAAAENSTVKLIIHDAGSPAATIEKATLTLAGNRRNADLSVHLQNPRPAGVSEQLWSPATLTAQANWSDPLLSADIMLQNEAGDHLDISGELPVDHAPDTFRFQPAGSISGSADINANMEPFSPLLLPPKQQLSGTLRGQFRVNGTLAEPEMEGTATLDKGQYEHADLGTLLENLSLACRAEGRKLEISEFSAEDGEGGTVKLNGHIELSENGAPFRAHLSLHLDKMNLVRLQHASVHVSGKTELRRGADSAGLEGALSVNPVELRIPSPQPKGMDGINLVTEQQAETRAETDTKSPAKNRTEPDLPLDVKISIPGRCFLRGRGLDSEWSGELHVTGTDKEPTIRGKMTLVRGHATILTKRFDLEKGKATFAGQAPPRPVLDILAVHETADLRVNLQVTGPVTNPELTLSSVPSLPRDEILSRLLFGRELGEITPQMAVKLALAVRTLTTGKMGLLQRFRSGLGLDTLELKTTEGDEAETVVGVGKYLGEDVYFQVERGMSRDSTQVTVEMELTPNLSVESQAGALNQGIKLKWRYRY